MKKPLSIAVIVFSFLLLTGFSNENHQVDSLKFKKPMTLEELYESMDYVKAKNAIIKYEEKYKTKISLPSKTPFRVNLSYGKIDESRLILAFLGKDKKDLFKIIVEPFDPKHPELKHPRKKSYKLQNGSEVVVTEIDSNPEKLNASYLFLQKNKFQYILGIYDLEKYDSSTLISVAETIK